MELLSRAEASGAEVKVMDMSRKPPTSPLPEARIEELRAVKALYDAPNPFKVGDLITPRKNGGLRGHGIPHIVVEVLEGDEVVRRWDGNPAGGDYGRKADIRVLGIAPGPEGDNIIPWWSEHFQYEAFDVEQDYTPNDD